MTPDDSREIIRQLAIVGEQVAGVRRDIVRQDQAAAEEREDSHASRRDLHEKVNGVAINVATLTGDVKAAADTVADLQSAVEKAAPTIADVENAKKIGGILLWFIGGAGIAALAGAVAYGEAVKAWLAHWLGISK